MANRIMRGFRRIGIVLSVPLLAAAIVLAVLVVYDSRPMPHFVPVDYDPFIGAVRLSPPGVVLGHSPTTPKGLLSDADVGIDRPQVSTGANPFDQFDPPAKSGPQFDPTKPFTVEQPAPRYMDGRLVTALILSITGAALFVFSIPFGWIVSGFARD
jgi:hypothetical protein